MRPQSEAEQAAKLRLALKAGELGLWSWDPKSGSVEWDEKLEEIFGLPPGGFDGKYETYLSLLHDDDRESVLRAIEEALETKTGHHVIHRIVRPGGEIAWMEGWGTVQLDDSNEVVSLLGVARDVTARQRAIDSKARLQTITDAAIGRLSVGDLTKELVARIRDTIEADTARLLLLSPDGTYLSGGGAIGPEGPMEDPVPIPVGHGFAGGIAATRRPRLVFDISSIELIGPFLKNAGVRSVAGVPVIEGGDLLGVLHVGSRTPRQFDDQDVAVLEHAADRIGVALRRARAEDSVRRTADALQRSLLPKSVPAIPGLDIAASYHSAGGDLVGGDFYDVFQASDTSWCVAIGDVEGKGVDAATMTSLVRHTIRAATRFHQKPSEILETVHEAVREAATDTFCTALIALVEPENTMPTITFACGGHPLPLLVHGDDAQLVGQPGTLLGLIDPASASDTTLNLSDADWLLLYTDGLTDVPPPFGLDDEALREMASACTRATAWEIADSVEKALENILPFEKRTDDTAFVVIRPVIPPLSTPN
ncbi:MAG: SpoIIE family protein phosphatase [Actinomycetota bacterium]